MTFGETISKIKKDKNLLIRHSSAFLEVDVAFARNIKRGECSANSVERLKEFLLTPSEPLLTIWFADKIRYAIEE